jgi:acyl dehydratase
VLQQELYAVDGVRMAVNYGLDRVRFMSPVPVGSKVRARAEVVGADSLDGAVQVTFSTTFEIDGVDKPAAVVTSIARFIA